MPEEFFRIRNLKKMFGKHVVLSGIDLEVYKGEVFGIIGTSGSGKTTFLNSMIGFLKPDQGEIRVLVEPTHRALGEPTYKEVYTNLKIIKNIYGFASQIPSFYDNLTVRENLFYFGSLYGMHKRNIHTNMQILLHLMDLEPAQKLLAKNLSGGMERRLDIACALMHDPAVLVLDEPTADLDPVLRNHIYELIKKINAKNTTIILASHHLSDIEKVCDRVAILKDGKILAVGTPEAIKDEFSDFQRVFVKVVDGDSHKYDVIVDHMHKKYAKYMVKEKSGSDGLVFLTKHPQSCAEGLVDVLSTLKEKTEALQISKPSLDELFVAIMGGDNPYLEHDKQSKGGVKKDEEKGEEKDNKKKEEKKEEEHKERATHSSHAKHVHHKSHAVEHHSHDHHKKDVVKKDEEKDNKKKEEKKEEEHKERATHAKKGSEGDHGKGSSKSADESKVEDAKKDVASEDRKKHDWSSDEHLDEVVEQLKGDGK